MNIPFIYKYKPKKLGDFEINDQLKQLLVSLTQNNNLNIIFLGNSGVGKTSIIDSLIRYYYGDKYSSDNILQINNLKEQGIQYYRNEVKTFCQTQCLVSGKKKCVILDDIDLINEQSQQVFRNCIDKYSHNVNFISSCCNLQKVIDTLQSRKIIINIPPHNMSNMKNVLVHIAKNENMEIDNELQDFIIKLSNNSLRIMINYLEKLKIINLPITYDLVNNICSNISYKIFDDYTSHLLNNNLHAGIEILYNLYDCGYSTMDIYDNYFLYIKTTSLIQNDNMRYEIIKWLCKYITIFHNIHEDEIELALMTHDIINNVMINDK
jgi:DNA polymerase III delta prime subunit